MSNRVSCRGHVTSESRKQLEATNSALSLGFVRLGVRAVLAHPKFPTILVCSFLDNHCPSLAVCQLLLSLANTCSTPCAALPGDGFLYASTIQRFWSTKVVLGCSWQTGPHWYAHPSSQSPVFASLLVSTPRSLLLASGAVLRSRCVGCGSA